MGIKVRNKNNRLFSDDQEITIIEEYKDSTPETRVDRKYQRVVFHCKRLLGIDI